MATLFYPPVYGRPGSNPTDWPNGRFPADKSEAVNIARAGGHTLVSSDDNLPIYSPQGPVPLGSPLSIDISKQFTPESWAKRNWVWLAVGGVGLVLLLVMNANPGYRED